MAKERQGLRSGIYNTRSKKSIITKFDQCYYLKKVKQYNLFGGSYIIYRKNKLSDVPNSWYIKFGSQGCFFGGQFKKKYEIIPISKKFIKKTYVVGKYYKFNNLIKKVIKEREWTLVSSIFFVNNTNETTDLLSIYNK